MVNTNCRCLIKTHQMGYFVHFELFYASSQEKAPKWHHWGESLLMYSEIILCIFMKSVNVCLQILKHIKWAVFKMQSGCFPLIHDDTGWNNYIFKKRTFKVGVFFLKTPTFLMNLNVRLQMVRHRKWEDFWMKFGNKLIRNHYSKLQMLKDIKNENH